MYQIKEFYLNYRNNKIYKLESDSEEIVNKYINISIRNYELGFKSVVGQII
jgi:hypothetical protein